MRAAAIALALATLFFGRQIASWSAAQNRYLYHWQRADSLYLVGAVVVAAAIALAVQVAVRRFGGPAARRGLRLAFALALGQVVVGLILAPDAEKPFEGAGLAAVVTAGLTLFLFRRAEARVVKVSATVALLAAPLGPILFVQILSWRSWRRCPEPAPERPAAVAPGPRPVFILLFDEWSLSRSERDGEFLPELVNLRRLAARATVYREARSAGGETRESIPRLLYGAQGEVVVGNDGVPRWKAGDSLVPAAGRSNLFRRAQELGYRTELAGWYLPYGALVGDDLDRCVTWPQSPKRDGPARLADLLWANLRYLPDPLSRAVWRALYSRWFSAHWYALEGRIEREAMRLAREAPDNVFALVHFALPHAPFVFQADGSYAGPFQGGRMSGTVDEYGRQIRYMDVVLGRFLDALAASGRLDSAVVIVTSDHGWKKDPDAKERARLRRVPLVVKGRGREGASVVEKRFCSLELHRLLVGGPAEPADCSAP